MKATQETIAEAMKIQEIIAILRGYDSGMREKHFAIFEEEKLKELNRKSLRKIRYEMHRLGMI